MAAAAHNLGDILVAQPVATEGAAVVFVDHLELGSFVEASRDHIGA